MKKSRSYFILFLISTAVCAQPMSLEDFNQRFEEELEKISQTRQKQKSALKIKYLGALLRMETDAKNKGNLELVQAVRTEISRVENDEPLPLFSGDIPAELKEMQQLMENLQNQYQKEESGAVIALVDTLKEYAGSRSVEATRQNDISQAVAWREWEEKLSENEIVRGAYAHNGQSVAAEDRGGSGSEEYHKALRGRPAEIIEKPATQFSTGPKVFRNGSEPKGNEKRIRSTTPSMQGAGNTKLTGTVILIEEKDITKSGWSNNFKEKSLIYVPRLSISPLVGKKLDRCLVVFDLYKRGTGSKRSIIRTDKILIPPLSAEDRVVVDAGQYAYETEEYDSSWSTYDYKTSTADEFYGYIVTIFDKNGEMIFQRATERILKDYARETPP